VYSSTNCIYKLGDHFSGRSGKLGRLGRRLISWNGRQQFIASQKVVSAEFEEEVFSCCKQQK